MDRKTIADAIRYLETILTVLDNAYWEASSIQHKDSLYDLIAIVHAELNETAKLSVEDHYIAYEPISAHFRASGPRFRLLQNNLHQWIPRSVTAQQLDLALADVLRMHGRAD